MTSSSNGNGNLVDEFEEAFQNCLHALTKQESTSGIDKDEIKLEVDQTTTKFIDLARQMEAFFLQKRFLLSALKPELVLKEENLDLRFEISRKDDFIKKHCEKIDQWKTLLSDTQQQNYSKMQQQQQQQQQQSIAPPIGPMSNASGSMVGMVGSPTPPMQMQGIPSAMQAQLQQQHLQSVQQQHLLQQQQLQQMQQQQQQQQQQQIQIPPGFLLSQQPLPTGSPQLVSRGGLLGGPGNVVGGNVGVSGVVGATSGGNIGQVVGGGGGGVNNNTGGFNQGQNVLPGPLAYLEKSASNIDLVGMGDGRR